MGGSTTVTPIGERAIALYHSIESAHSGCGAYRISSHSQVDKHVRASDLDWHKKRPPRARSHRSPACLNHHALWYLSYRNVPVPGPGVACYVWLGH
jgi:hypothetical protein